MKEIIPQSEKVCSAQARGLTFNQYLQLQTHRQDPVGDLARDAKQDSAHKGWTHPWWERHLERMNACREAFSALDQAWIEFEFSPHVTTRQARQ